MEPNAPKYPGQALRKTRLLAGFLLLALLILAVFGGLATGTYDFSKGEIFRALAGEEIPNRVIIIDLRLPRVILAICSGAVLALSGFYMQALIKNPLADPYIMGLTAGAGFGVNLLILGLIPFAIASWFVYPLFAFLGGALSLLLLMLLGWKSLMEDSARLLIAGVAVAAIFTAITGFMIYTLADSDQVRRIVFWTFGSLGRANWPAAWTSLAMLVVAMGFGWIYARKMDLLVLGDVQARTLGMEVRTVKILLLLVTSLVVGGIVAFTGPIGFVGMMIPHFCRPIFGPSHRPNMVLGALMGGTYLLICDLLTRWILPPAGLPIGIITAILGVPFFLYILFSGKNYL